MRSALMEVTGILLSDALVADAPFVLNYAGWRVDSLRGLGIVQIDY